MLIKFAFFTSVGGSANNNNNNNNNNPTGTTIIIPPGKYEYQNIDHSIIIARANKNSLKKLRKLL